MQPAFDYHKSLLGIVEKLVGGGHFEEATFWLERLNSCFPQSPFGNLIWANLALRRADLAGAVDQFREYLSKQPAHVEVQIKLFDTLMKLERFNDARDQLVAIQKQFNNPPAIQRKYAQLLGATGMRADGIKLLLDAIAKDPQDPMNYSALAELWMDEGKLENVEQLLRIALKIKPNCRKADKAFLRFYDLSGRSDSTSIKLGIENDIDASDDIYDITMASSKMLLKRGMVSHAASVIREVAHLFPDERLNKALDAFRIDCLKVRPPYNSRQLVFVAHQPRARMLNFARAMQEYGWDIILICYDGPDAMHHSCFREVRKYKSEDDALNIAAEYNPRAYHVFSGNADPMSVLFCKYKPGYVIFDGYDLLEGLIKSDYVYEVGQMQRFCMQNADALTTRDLRTRYLRENLGYKLPEKLLYFTDYCISKHDRPISRVQNPKEIHIAACGWFVTNKCGAEVDWGYLEMGRRFAAQGIHLHLFLHPTQLHGEHFAAQFVDYKQFESQSKYFHLHEPVPMEDLSRVLSQFDFGINATYALEEHQYRRCYTDAHFKYCLSARNIEYLDAGIPVILNGTLHRAQYRMFNRYKIAINTSAEFFNKADSILRNFLRDPELPNRIFSCHQSYSMQRHQGRLNAFYESIPLQRNSSSVIATSTQIEATAISGPLTPYIQSLTNVARSPKALLSTSRQ